MDSLVAVVESEDLARSSVGTTQEHRRASFNSCSSNRRGLQLILFFKSSPGRQASPG